MFLSMLGGIKSFSRNAQLNAKVIVTKRISTLLEVTNR